MTSYNIGNDLFYRLAVVQKTPNSSVNMNIVIIIIIVVIVILIIATVFSNKK